MTNRGNGTISVIDFATARIRTTWRIPEVAARIWAASPDGRVLWVSGRYNAVVYAISTTMGRLLAEIPVGPQPHGLCAWPQPGRTPSAIPGLPDETAAHRPGAERAVPGSRVAVAGLVLIERGRAIDPRGRHRPDKGPRGGHSRHHHRPAPWT